MVRKNYKNEFIAADLMETFHTWKSLVSMNSIAPLISLSPASTRNCPLGDQNMVLQARFSSFFSSVGAWPLLTWKNVTLTVGASPLMIANLLSTGSHSKHCTNIRWKHVTKVLTKTVQLTYNSILI